MSRRAVAILAILAFSAVFAGPAGAQPATPYSLNGTWEWRDGATGTVYQDTVTHVGASVTGRLLQRRSCGISSDGNEIGWAQGSIDLQGTLSAGGIINGQTAVCRYEDETFQVPVAAEYAPVVLSVSNDGLGLVGSYFDQDRLIDVPATFTKRPSFSTSTFALNDDAGSALKYLSTGTHPYFKGNTRIYGALRLQLLSSDTSLRLNSVVLEVVQDGVVRATAGLEPTAQTVFINQPFTVSGGGRFLGTTASRLLFLLPPTQTGLVTSTATTTRLRLKITTTAGEEFIKEYGSSLQPLVRYTGSNRYGERDNTVGGDDWIRPSVKKVLDYYASTYRLQLGLTYGDMSNMNGGAFPPHQGHDNGAQVDAHFTGYNARSADVADTMVMLLNDPKYGRRIQKVLVTYSEGKNCDTFCRAIKDVRLTDGRLARDVIRPYPSHDTHFHWNIAP